MADEVVGTMANCVDYPIFFTVFYSACVGQYFLLWFYRFITGLLDVRCFFTSLPVYWCCHQFSAWLSFRIARI